MLRRQRLVRTQIQKLLDAALFALGLWLAHLWRSHWKIAVFGGAAEIAPFENYSRLYLVILPLVPLLLGMHGFYQRSLFPSRRQTLWALFKTCVIATISLIIVIFLFRAQDTLARSVIILFGLVSFGLVCLKEELIRWGLESEFGQAQLRRRLILLGTKDETARLRLEIKRSVREGNEILCEVDLNDCSVAQLVELIHEKSPNGVIVNAKHNYFDQVEKAIQACEIEGVPVWLMADFFKTHISRPVMDDFHGRPVLVFQTGPESSWQAFFKVVLDLLGSMIMLVLLTPVLGLVAMAIKLTSPGPILFRQMRSGLNGRPFVMYKFRSMVTNAEQLQHELASMNEMSGPVFKVTNDPRITPIGRFLRKYSLDELPQFFNVLRGNMSLVGPRPLPVDEVKRFNDVAHRRRLSVKPGLTCLWQISGRNQVSKFEDWVRLDLEYIDSWSLLLDIKILLFTVPVVLMGKGAK